MFPMFFPTEQKKEVKMTTAQLSYCKAIQNDTTKEIYDVYGDPEKLSVCILDHTLSLLFKCPIKVVVLLDLLANENKVTISKSGVTCKSVISWENHGDREQTNCWSQDYMASRTIAYWDTIKIDWVCDSHTFTDEERIIVRLAEELFNSAEDGGSAEYRGSRISIASLEAPKKKQKTA